MQESELKRVLVERFSKMKGVQTGANFIYKIRCNGCGQSEAFVRIDNPFYAECNRRNNCSDRITKYSEYFPDLNRKAQRDEDILPWNRKLQTTSYWEPVTPPKLYAANEDIRNLGIKIGRAHV